MAEEMAWYDRYYQFKDSATLIIAEKHTLFRMVGDIRGQDVLDLACGNGFYTRQFKERGAARVVGCDISSGPRARTTSSPALGWFATKTLQVHAPENYDGNQ